MWGGTDSEARQPGVERGEIQERGHSSTFQGADGGRVRERERSHSSANRKKYREVGQTPVENKVTPNRRRHLADKASRPGNGRCRVEDVVRACVIRGQLIYAVLRCFSFLSLATPEDGSPSRTEKQRVDPVVLP